MKRLTNIALLLCISVLGYAQDTISTCQPVRSCERYVSTELGIGHLNQLDTYLSYEKYRGAEIEFISEVVKDSKKHPLTFILTHEGAFSNARNRADNASFLSGHYDFAYAIMRKWEVFNGNDNINGDDKPGKLTIRAGGFINADLGFCYFTKAAANNPAQGYGSMNIGPEIMVTYNIRLFKKVMRLSYEARVPLVGMMFSPNYGQSYYEIFTRKNYDHNIVFTSIATFQLRHQLSLDIPVSKRCAIRVGYLGDIRQSTPNNLKQHQWYNAAVIGVTIKK